MASFLASGVLGLVMIVFTVPAQFFVDRWGRRKPLILGELAVSLCFIVIGALYAKYGIPIDGAVLLQSRAAQWVVVMLIYVFVANFSWSWAIVSFSSVPDSPTSAFSLKPLFF